MRYPDEVPELSDGVVTLRAYRCDDVARIIEFAGDERSRRWVPLPHPYGAEQATQFLDQMGAHWQADPVHPNWAIDLDGRYAGGINIRQVQPGTWEVGFSAHPDTRGRGAVSRAARLARDYAFDVLDARTLTWRAGRGNFASRRVAWSIGVTVDGSWPGTHRGTDGPIDDTWFGHVHRADRDAEPRPWWVPAVLTGEHIVLRPWTEADRPGVQPDEVSACFVEDMQPSAEIFDEWLLVRRERMAEGGMVFWAVADRATDEVLGHLQVTRLNIDFVKGTGTVGYWLCPAARGRGVLQEALDLLIPHAFAPRTDRAGVEGGLGLHRLYAGTDEDNRASGRALRRAGFVECATERDVLAHDDRPPTGAISFELLAGDDRESQRVQPLSVPTVRTERFILREWTSADSPLPEQVADPDARRFMANELPTPQTFPVSLRNRRLGADRGRMISWCIEDAATGEVLGNAGLFSIGEGTPSSAEVGYWLWKQARGRGVISEVLDAILGHGFGTLGLTRIHAETDLENIASQRILLRAGFRLWGTDRQAYTNADGSVTDGAYFELLASDRDRRLEMPSAPIVHGAGVRLRPLRMCDVDRVHAASTDPLFTKWLDGETDHQLQDTRAWLARELSPTKDRVRWAITDSSDRFLGCVTLQNINASVRSAEVGYWLHPDARGRGVATAALRTLVKHAFSTEGAGLRRLGLNVGEGNEESIRVAQRAGFTVSGRDRLAEPLGDGGIVDLIRFELLAD